MCGGENGIRDIKVKHGGGDLGEEGDQQESAVETGRGTGKNKVRQVGMKIPWGKSFLHIPTEKLTNTSSFVS